MASYAEILTAAEDADLNNKIRVAVVIAAEAVRSEATPPANQVARLAWAKSVFEQPDGEVIRMKWAVLAQNKDATLAQILGSSDSQVQIAVNAAIDVFAGG